MKPSYFQLRIWLVPTQVQVQVQQSLLSHMKYIQLISSIYIWCNNEGHWSISLFGPLLRYTFLISFHDNSVQKKGKKRRENKRDKYSKQNSNKIHSIHGGTLNSHTFIFVNFYIASLLGFRILLLRNPQTIYFSIRKYNICDWFLIGWEWAAITYSIQHYCMRFYASIPGQYTRP